MDNQETARSLISQARTARDRALAPLSKVLVGAALSDAEGRTFLGCTIETRDLVSSLCAEQVAVANALAAGATLPFSALALSACHEGSPGDTEERLLCGACR